LSLVTFSTLCTFTALASAFPAASAIIVPTQGASGTSFVTGFLGDRPRLAAFARLTLVAIRPAVTLTFLALTWNAAAIAIKRLLAIGLGSLYALALCVAI
jgi:uncharacterized membrane protein YhaH (DUF805 family)